MSQRLYLDLAPFSDFAPQPGDVVVGQRREWRIIEAWPTESRIWPYRWTLRLGPGMPIGSLQPLGPHNIRIPTRRYEPGERPGDWPWGPSLRRPDSDDLAGVR